MDSRGEMECLINVNEIAPIEPAVDQSPERQTLIVLKNGAERMLGDPYFTVIERLKHLERQQ